MKYFNNNPNFQRSFAVIKNGIKGANSLPNGGNFNYYTCFPIFHEIRNDQIKKVIDSMQSIIGKAGIAGSIQQRDIDEKFDLLLEANDVFLDRAVSKLKSKILILPLLISKDFSNYFLIALLI